MPEAPIVKVRDGLVINWWNMVYLSAHVPEECWKEGDPRRKPHYHLQLIGSASHTLSAEEGKRLEKFLVGMGTDLTRNDPPTTTDDGSAVTASGRFQDCLDDETDP